MKFKHLVWGACVKKKLIEDKQANKLTLHRILDRGRKREHDASSTEVIQLDLASEIAHSDFKGQYSNVKDPKNIMWFPLNCKQASFDCCQPPFFFQITTVKCHPVKKKGIDKALSFFNTIPKNSGS